MARETLRRHLFVNNQFFEQILRDHFEDHTIFLKTYEVLNVSKREESYWCDQIQIAANYTNCFNTPK